MKLEEAGYRKKFMAAEGQEQSSMEETGLTEMKQSLSLTTDRYGEIFRVLKIAF